MEQTSEARLSVIIPVYNAADTIRATLDSVRMQKIPGMEILCVDDGSTDNSVEVLERIAREDETVRVICQSNRSAGAARNNGLSHARGRYVHFLDADDLLCPGIYQKAIDRLEQTGAAVCMFQYRLLDGATGEEKNCPCLLNGRERVTSLRQEPAFFLYNMVAPWNKLYRRDWIEEHTLRFDEIRCGNDRGFYFRMLASGAKIALMMDYGVRYRVNNAASLTGVGRWRHFDSLFYAWDSSAKALEGESEAVRAMLLDCVMRDLLAVLRTAPKENRPQVLEQLREKFERVDFSVGKALPLPCIWRRDRERIMAGEDPCDLPVSAGDRLRAQWAACRIWGLRGRAVKFLAGRGK